MAKYFANCDFNAGGKWHKRGEEVTSSLSGYDDAYIASMVSAGSLKREEGAPEIQTKKPHKRDKE